MGFPGSRWFAIAAASLALACSSPSPSSSTSTAAGGHGGSTPSAGGSAGQMGGGGSSGDAGDGGMAGDGGGAGTTTDSGTSIESGIADAPASDLDATDGRIVDAGEPEVDARRTDAGRSAEAGTTDAGAQRVTIMPLGDSITYGSGGTNAGYRGPLYNLLKSLPQKVLFVGSSAQAGVSTTVDPLPAAERHNEGHPSYNMADISANLDGFDDATFVMYGGASRDPNGGHWFDGIAGDANSRPPLYPDIILMMVGTNNLNATDRVDVRNQLHALMTKITTQRPNAKLIVAQVTPTTRPNVATYNADVASEVKGFQAAGQHVSMVDMNTGFPADGLGPDNVHPNDTGYAFMAKRWYDGIVAVLP